MKAKSEQTKLGSAPPLTLPSALTEYPVELAPPRGAQEGLDMYFEVLELQPMRLSLSFMRTERVNAEEKCVL